VEVFSTATMVKLPPCSMAAAARSAAGRGRPPAIRRSWPSRAAAPCRGAIPHHRAGAESSLPAILLEPRTGAGRNPIENPCRGKRLEATLLQTQTAATASGVSHPAMEVLFRLRAYRAYRNLVIRDRGFSTRFFRESTGDRPRSPI